MKTIHCSGKDIVSAVRETLTCISGEDKARFRWFCDSAFRSFYECQAIRVETVSLVDKNPPPTIGGIEFYDTRVDLGGCAVLRRLDSFMTDIARIIIEDQNGRDGRKPPEGA